MSARSGAALQRHHALLPQCRRALPDRVWTTLVPLLRVIAQDVNSTGQISVSVDLRGPLVKDKVGPRLRVAPGVTEQHHLDPWLRVAARLRDGSQLQLTLTTRVRNRRITRFNSRGKMKTKHRSRTLLVVTATRTVARGRPIRRPATPPPPWIMVRLRTQPKVVLTASAKLPPPQPQEEINLVLAVMTEPFRWTPAVPGAYARSRAR